MTNKIIKMLETAQANGAELPWCRPGVAHSRPTNVASKQRYRGINVLSLWGEADARNFRSGLWGTYKQWVRRDSRMKGVTDESMSSVQLCRHFPRAAPATGSCEAGMKA